MSEQEHVQQGVTAGRGPQTIEGAAPGTAMETAAHEGSGGEFEREPVPQNRLLGFKSFIGCMPGSTVRERS